MDQVKYHHADHGLFAPGAAGEVPEPPASDGAGAATEPRGEEPPPRDGADAGEQACGVAKGAVVDCGCCGGVLSVLPVSQARLLYGGGVANVTIFAGPPGSAGCRVLGQVPVWTLGGRTPTLFCQDEMIHCQCEGEGWREEESRCARGDICKPPNVHKHDAAAQEAEDVATEGPPHLQVVERLQELHSTYAAPAPAVAASLWPGDAEQAGACLQRGREEGPPCADPVNRTRLALGGARCEDVDLEQCEQFYMRTGCTWQSCQVRRAALVCFGRTDTEDNLREREALLGLAVTGRDYTPSLDWPLAVDERGCARPAGVSREELLSHLLRPGDREGSSKE